MALSQKRPVRRAKGQSAAPPDPSQVPSAVAQTRGGKSIFLFADGTGNSSAKLFKTNVWRMYEAIDFGLDSPGKYVQIGYYDNGVGTSNFKPLALLGGIFGIGLQDNVLRLYAFLCRNYQPGDRIYVFGFSRGAFTIRLLVGLVASQGILKPGDDAALSLQVRDAYRAFRRAFVPHRWLGRVLVAIGRAVRDGLVKAKRAISRQHPDPETGRIDAEIEFVGVWDTVAAYGGPSVEFTRGIDDWIYPLSMPEYGLPANVKKARHALSLDDERDAFWPLLWDEVIETKLVENGKVSAGRLKQVWFSGVHSDVGGGYPDESLSYIPFLWMMDELDDDVDFIDSFVQRARNLANPYGPIHDSRSGLAAYYRYQPRKIAAFTDPPSISTLSMRPPPTDAGIGSHGLLRSVCVHESAIARIISGIDNYAPSALPGEFDLVLATGSKAKSALSQPDLTRLRQAEAGRQQRYELQENAWDLVWWRRFLYFLTVGLTATLVLAPWLSPLEPVEQLCSDDRCFARSFVDMALFFVPESVRSWLDPWVSRPLLVILFGALILLSITFGRRTERGFRDRVKNIWRSYLDRDLECFKGRTSLRETRESAGYQRSFTLLKWGLLPTLCGLGSLAAIAYAILILLTQVLYAVEEPGSAFCKPASGPGTPDKVKDVLFDTRDSCTDLGVEVRQGQPYRLALTPLPPIADAKKGPWLDKTLYADPRHGVTSPHAYMTLVAPLKRVTSANWMQVLTENRAGKPDSELRRLVSPVFGMPLDIRKHDLRLRDGTYQTIFCPRWDGHLYIMVNDAAPLAWKHYYENNQGRAAVSVEPAPDKQCR